MHTLNTQVLRLDVAGTPLEWVDYQEAVRLYASENVVYTLGSPLYVVHGGISAVSGCRSEIEVNSIIATQGHSLSSQKHYVPHLTNSTLFKRDDYHCMYCGGRFSKSDLSRDHINPLSQRGRDIWQNVITACKRCNNHKAGRTPEQAGMELLAIPFEPNHAEYIFLKGRRILADQMDFLRSHFPKKSPFHERIQRLL